MKHLPAVILVDDEPDEDLDEGLCSVEEAAPIAMVDPPSVLAWWEHSDGYVVESNGARWLIGPGDIAGIERLSRLIRAEFGAPCAGNC